MLRLLVSGYSLSIKKQAIALVGNRLKTTRVAKKIAFTSHTSAMVRRHSHAGIGKIVPLIEECGFIQSTDSNFGQTQFRWCNRELLHDKIYILLIYVAK